MKTYHLSYEFLGEARNLTFDTIIEWDVAFNKVLDNPNVPDSTIDFSTTEKVVPVRKPKDKRRYIPAKFKPDFAPKKQ